MSRCTLAEQGRSDPESHPLNSNNTDDSLGRKLLDGIMTCRGLFTLLVLLFFVAIFNTTVFVVLRSAFTPPTHHPIMMHSEQTTENSINRDLKGVNGSTMPSEQKNLMDLKDSQSQQNSVVITKSCGGIMNIPRNSKGYIVDQLGDLGDFERCAWIIKSEAKRVKVRYANQSLAGTSGTTIGELGAGDESLRCHNLYSDPENAKTVRTPFVLYFTTQNPGIYLGFNSGQFVIELTPVDDGGTHESQPATYHINTITKGSLPLAAAPMRSDSLLEMMTVFQTQKPTGAGRDFVCSPTGTDQCCNYVTAYTMDLFESLGGSCGRISTLNNGAGKGSSDDTVVVLYWSHKIDNESECRLTWSEKAHNPCRSIYGCSWRVGGYL